MKRRRTLRVLSAAFSFVLITSAIGYLAVLHPNSPLPPHWNPSVPIDLNAPATPVTDWKIAGASEGQACFSALAKGDVVFRRLPDLEDSPQCGIEDRLVLSEVAGIALDPVETRCATALRLTLWAEHGLKPAAQSMFGTGVSRLHHFSSYNCRAIRTTNGTGNRMSTHATAEAIDIAGVTLADGQRITLLRDWGSGDRGAFLEAARDSACRWFVTTLGPDYNRLHADHFHLQSRGWGLCR